MNITVIVFIRDAATAEQIIKDVTDLATPHFLEEIKGECPNCRHSLKHGDGDDLPPVYCDYCGLGWPALYPTPAHTFIRIEHGQESHS